jgi:ATP-dependent Clp protease ATP-binding subunit ClpB
VKPSKLITLDPSARGQDSLEFESNLRDRIVGQDEAVVKTTEVIQKYLSGFSAKGRPIANMLFLGPTGTGKSYLVESIADILFSDRKAIVKISCAEFQASHDIAKLIGAPPGYVGHNEKSSRQLIDQEKLDKNSVEGKKLALVLFDEIEKASDALWNLLLGITDKAEMTTSTGVEINFEHSIIFMTSNLGASQMEKAIGARLGFGTPIINDSKVLSNIATSAAKKNFRPEFMNRLDHVVVFQSLDRAELINILKYEMSALQKRILYSDNHVKFAFAYSDKVLDFLLEKGYDRRYGARHIKRAVEKHVMTPLTNLVMSGQLEFGDLVFINNSSTDLKFSKIPAKLVGEMPDTYWSQEYLAALE